MSSVEYKWTDGANEAFHRFYLITEEYYSKIVGGVENRKSFIPYNVSMSIQDVLIAYIDDVPVACSGLKKYSEKEIEIKRVWVEPEYRGHHIATDMMEIIEALDGAICFAKDLNEVYRDIELSEQQIECGQVKDARTALTDMRTKYGI